MPYYELIFQAGATALDNLKLISQGQHVAVIDGLLNQLDTTKKKSVTYHIDTEYHAHHHDGYVLLWSYNKGVVILLEKRNEAN